MIGRSLVCSPEGIQKAKKALVRFSLTQKALADELEVTRQPIGKFLTGKPIDRKLFIQICETLELDWEKVVAQPPSERETQANQDNNINIDALVQEVRAKIKPLIQEHCSTMRVLDMTQPIGLDDIYTSVNILETITGRRRKGIAEFLQQCSSEDFERFGLSKITQERVPGLEAISKYPKLMILGKPGAGKTTFLKYLAIQCMSGKFYSHLIPIFITLKNFAEADNKPGLLEYITLFVGQGYHLSSIKDEQNTDSIKITEQLLSQGRAFIFLDGLDEVREEDSQRILKDIRDFSDKYRDNYFVITCRIAAREYIFEKFTEVEVADFDDEQIATFSIKWFQDKAVKAETFIKRIKEDNRIKELAQSPLLLTLLCLAFEESGDFPANRSELYKEGLDALLKKWDAKRGIQRDQVYKKLSVQRKEDLLSKIALTTFELGDYFFKQKVAEQYITEYIRNISGKNTPPEVLQLDSERVLKSIEHHHGLLVERAKGIYSFSHLTFHEYFTAREIILVKQSSEEALQSLVKHINDKRWREVFLLAVGMSPSADRLLLLMKEKIDSLLNVDEKLQQFLIQIYQKKLSVNAPYKQAFVREFLFVFALGSFLRPSKNCAVTDLDLSLVSNHYSLSNITFYNQSHFQFNLVLSPNIERLLFYGHSRNIRKVTYSIVPEIKQGIQVLTKQLPNPKTDLETRKQWWKVNGDSWINQLRAVMSKSRSLGYDWQFSRQQKSLLNQYYNAHLLLMECLNSDGYVSCEVRQKIEDELFLPIVEIKKR